MSDTTDEECEAVVPRSVAATAAFLEQARALAAWHYQVANGFEQKAGVLLGFSGVVIGLLPLAAKPIGRLDGDARSAATVLAVLGAGAMVGAATAALMALRPRKYAFASRPQLRRAWEAYRDNVEGLEEEQVLGLFADQLLASADPSPVDSLAKDSEARAAWVHWSMRSMIVGFVLLAAMATVLLIMGV